MTKSLLTFIERTKRKQMEAERKLAARNLPKGGWALWRVFFKVLGLIVRNLPALCLGYKAKRAQDKLDAMSDDERRASEGELLDIAMQLKKEDPLSRL